MKNEKASFFFTFQTHSQGNSIEKSFIILFGLRPEHNGAKWRQNRHSCYFLFFKRLIIETEEITRAIQYEP